MNKTSSNIFLHYLNKDTQEIFGILDAKDAVNSLKMGLNASILLCNEYCFMPLGFYFECQNTKKLILENLEFVKEGLLRFCIRENDLKEYLEKKQGQLKRFANDITYQGFFDKEYTAQLLKINPTFLNRNTKVGEYCVDKWVTQHRIFLSDQSGDMNQAYHQISEIEEKKKIMVGIERAAIETREGAFVWNVIDKKYKDLNIADQTLYKKLRELFEKYYYEAYLLEYKASILYDFFLVDKGYDFSLKKEYNSIANYSWFYNFLKCLKLDFTLKLPAEKVVELKYMPEFILLMNIYREICNEEVFEQTSASMRNIIACKYSKDEKGIKNLVNEITKAMINTNVKGSRKSMMKEEREMIDVLIIIATEEEEQAILRNDADWSERKTSKGFTYFVKTEGLSFAMARAVEMRETETSIMGQYLIDELNPKYISMVGFCAGQDGKTNLGDVIVPYKIYRYGMGKRYSEGEKYPEISSFKINPIWKQKVERFGDLWRENVNITKPVDYEYQRYIFMKSLSECQTEIGPQDIWSKEEMPNLSTLITEFKEKGYITINKGKIALTEIGSSEVNNEMMEKYCWGFEESKPITKSGVLATGDDVQQWSEIFDELSKKYDRKTIALDMEAHAVASMAAFNAKPYIIAKGVGDYAQNNKSFDNRYIEYACYMAFRFVIEFFNSLTESEVL